jgi:hypothetical protein
LAPQIQEGDGAIQLTLQVRKPPFMFFQGRPSTSMPLMDAYAPHEFNHGLSTKWPSVLRRVELLLR